LMNCRRETGDVVGLVCSGIDPFECLVCGLFAESMVRRCESNLALPRRGLQASCCGFDVEGTFPLAEGTNPSVEGLRDSFEATNPSAEGTNASMEGANPSREGSSPPLEGMNPSKEGTNPST
jgi:hypothetical protein